MDSSLLKKTKLLFFNAHVLTKLTMLCKNNNSEVQEAALDLLTLLTTSTDVGICFFGKNGEFSTKYDLSFLLVNILSQYSQMFLKLRMLDRIYRQYAAVRGKKAAVIAIFLARSLSAQ